MRALSKEQYLQLWANLASGTSINMAAVDLPVQAHSITDIVRGRTYLDWFSTIPNKTILKVQNLANARCGKNQRATPKKPKKEINKITAELLTRMPWTTATLRYNAKEMSDACAS